MELSEYYMPGLGARLWEENAQQTALALNRINPDYIRIRTLALPSEAPLTAAAQAGTFAVPPDELVLRELQLFLGSLEGITSTIANDHIVNLLPEVEGKLPQDRDRMLDIINRYLEPATPAAPPLSPGPPTGLVLPPPGPGRGEVRAGRVAQICQENAITADTIDSFTTELLRRYISPSPPAHQTR